jgi:anti-sigma B factor antagonist
VDINVRRRGTVNVLQLKGNLTLGDPVNSFRSAVTELMQAGDSTFVIDLGAVSKMDSSGIGVLVNSLTASRKQGGNVKLVNPSEFARKTLQLVGVLKLFETFDREDAAVESYA